MKLGERTIDPHRQKPRSDLHPRTRRLRRCSRVRLHKLHWPLRRHVLMVLMPWTVINLIDFYAIHKGKYYIASFFRVDGGIYRKYNPQARRALRYRFRL
jgi:hypothetical protein